MNILLITEVLHPETIGGSGRVVTELAKNLAQAGHDVRIITRGNQVPEPRDERDGYQIFRYGVDKRNPVAYFQSTGRGIRETASRATFLWRPNIIEIHQPMSGFHAIKEPLLRGTPIIYNFHSSWADELSIKGFFQKIFAPIAAKVEEYVFARCDRIVCLSEFSRRKVLNLSPTALVTIVPGGVDLERFPLKQPRSRNSPPVILTVRNMVKRMGLSSLIEAAYILKHRGVEFVLHIGGKGPLERKLKAQAAGLGEACRFLGRIPESELSAVYQSADLFILPTQAIEGFGLVILESFASGTPVIGTPVGAIPELVGLQGHGYVTPEPDPDSIADAIQHFLESDEAVDAGTLREIADGYSWRRRADRMSEIYGEEMERVIGKDFS